MQLSKELHKKLSKKVFDYFCDNRLENAIKEVKENIVWKK